MNNIGVFHIANVFFHIKCNPLFFTDMQLLSGTVVIKTPGATSWYSSHKDPRSFSFLTSVDNIWRLHISNHGQFVAPSWLVMNPKSHSISFSVNHHQGLAGSNQYIILYRLKNNCSTVNEGIPPGTNCNTSFFVFFYQ